MTAAARACGGDGEAGLTLLEMLIVLAVIAVVTGATVLSLAPRRGTTAEAEARRLAAAIQSAADRAVVTGGRAVLAVDAAGYSVTGGPRHLWPPGMAVTGVPPGGVALGDGAPFDLHVAAGSERWTVGFDGVRTAVARDAGDAA